MIALLLMLAAGLQSPPDEVVLATRDTAEAGRQTLTVVGYRPPPGGVPAAQQDALFAVDFDGYSTGLCWAHLSTAERAMLDAVRARFNDRPSPESGRPAPGRADPVPVLDQVFHAGLWRGWIETRNKRPDPDLCQTMRENAPIALADLSGELAAFEAGLPPPLRRPALTEVEVTAEGRRLGRLAVLQPLCTAAGRPVEGDGEAPDLEALQADYMARVIDSGWSWARGQTALNEGAEGARAALAGETDPGERCGALVSGA